MKIKFKRDTSFRKQFFVPDSFAHPAKMDAQLLIWIVEHFTEADETILDPMAGSGTTMLACTLGRHCVLVELEEKFCKMMRDNWEQVKMRPQLGSTMGECKIIQGDARNLSGLCDKIISSPPYSDMSMGGGLNTKPPREGHNDQAGRSPKSPSQEGAGGYVDKIVTSPPFTGNTAWQDPAFQEKLKEKYGQRRWSSDGQGQDSPNNISKLPYGEIDKCIFSPPYAESVVAIDGEFYRKKAIDHKRDPDKPATKGASEGIDNPENVGNLPYGQINQIVNSEAWKQTLFGTLLGDAHLSWLRQYARPHLEIPHSTAQADYLRWKAEQLQPILGGKVVEKDERIRYRSSVSSYLAQIYPDYYDADGTKRLRQQALEKLNELGLAVWIMDDGSCSSNITMWIATHGYPLADVEVAKRWFKRRWSLDARIQQDGSGAKLAFNKKDAYKLAQIVKPYILPSLAYKIDIENTYHRVPFQVDKIVTSPPYEGMEKADKRANDPEEIDKRAREFEKAGGNFHTLGRMRTIKRAFEGYAENTNNIGNLKSQSYLEAMLLVYKSCFAVLRDDGLMILVTKNFIRNKQVIRLDTDTIKLCEQAGFSFVERHHRELPSQSFWRVIYHQKFPDVEQIKSEDVLVFRK